MFPVTRLRFHISLKTETTVLLGPEVLEVQHSDAGPWTSLTDAPEGRLGASAPLSYLNLVLRDTGWSYQSRNPPSP